MLQAVMTALINAGRLPSLSTLRILHTTRSTSAAKAFTPSRQVHTVLQRFRWSLAKHNRGFASKPRWVPLNSDRSVVWRKNPSTLEANLVVAIFLMQIVVTLCFITFVFVSSDNNAESRREEHFKMESSGVSIQELTGLFTAKFPDPNDQIYTDLLEINEVRLLILYPGDYETDIQVSLATVSLDAEYLKYEALSVGNAKQLVVVCGNVVFSWHILSGAMSYLLRYGVAAKNFDRKCMSACENITAMEYTRVQRLREPLFLTILANAAGECSDPRDKGFPMMGIAQGKDVFDWEVSMDYTLSVPELYKRVAILDILRHGRLRSLSCASQTSADSCLVPSWAPDWTRHMNTNLLVRHSETSGFGAAGDAKIQVRFSQDRKSLHLKGSIVDSVDKISSPTRLVNTSSVVEFKDEVVREFAASYQWLAECWRLASDSKPMDPRTYEAFWRTMVCNLTGSGHPAPKRFAKYFRTYMTFMHEGPANIERFLKEPQILAKSPDSESEEDIPSIFRSWFNKDFRAKSEIEDSLRKWSAARRFCRTKEGRLARVPEEAAPGDSICILFGSEVPYLLRPRDDNTYAVVGECYVHGLMHGEALSLPQFQPSVLRLT